MLEIIEAGPDLYADILEIWNLAWPEFAMDEDELRQRDTLDPALRSRFWIAREQGEIAGMLEIGPISGSQHPQRWTIGIVVSPKYRGEGVGAALYDFARNEIEPSSPLSIMTHVHEGDPESIRFVEARGFVEDKRDFYSTLDLDRVDRSLLKDLVAQPAPPGVRIVKGVDVDSEAFRHKLHGLFEEVRKDIPRSFPPTPLTFEQFQDAFIDPTFSWTCSMFAMRGEDIVGFSTAFKAVGDNRLLQGLTANSKDVRGMGLGKILKAHLIEQAIAEGYQTIGTDNDTRNAPIVAINESLGFKKQPGIIHYLWSANGS